MAINKIGYGAYRFQAWRLDTGTAWRRDTVLMVSPGQARTRRIRVQPRTPEMSAEVPMRSLPNLLRNLARPRGEKCIKPIRIVA